MPQREDIVRFRENWRAEADAIFLYEKMAASEKDSARAEIFRRLAQTEAKHRTFWEQKLQAAGAAIPRPRVSWRSRMFGWLAKGFGPDLVLPSLTAVEQNASSAYDDQPDAVSAGLPAQERSHARIFGYLARSGLGLEGGAVARLEGRHRFSGGNALRAGVLGANDGLVSNFCLVMGVAGAELSGNGILVTGLAGLLAGAISMALGEWLSVQSSRELYTHQIAVEKRELETVPEEEEEELALVYEAKGLSAGEARHLARRLLAEPESALDTLSREELGIDPKELGGSAWTAAASSFLLFALGAALPVLPFVFWRGSTALACSALGSAAGLFLLGSGITLVTGQPWLRSGARQVLFGLAAAAVTFGIGRLVGGGLGL